MRTLRIPLLVVVLAAALALVVAAERSHGATAKLDEHLAVKAIRRYRATTVRLRHVMGGRARGLTLAEGTSLERAHTIWRRRAVKLRRRFVAGPPHRGAWLCIHRYEGSWSDTGAPYYGGLQMDISFQQTYGSLLLRLKGTADRWTPLEQMWIAEKAYRSGRGFYPWPNTARACGLI